MRGVAGGAGRSLATPTDLTTSKVLATALIIVRRKYLSGSKNTSFLHARPQGINILIIQCALAAVMFAAVHART